MADQGKIYCRVKDADGRECNKEEILEKRQETVVRDAIHGQMTHHECPDHKFHVAIRDPQVWKLCDC